MFLELMKSLCIEVLHEIILEVFEDFILEELHRLYEFCVYVIMGVHIGACSVFMHMSAYVCSYCTAESPCLFCLRLLLCDGLHGCFLWFSLVMVCCAL